MSNNTEQVKAPYTVLLTRPDANGNRRAVREGNPEGVQLLVHEGCLIDKDTIRRYSLFGDPELNLSLDQIAAYETAQAEVPTPPDTPSSPEAPDNGSPIQANPPLSGVVTEASALESHPDDEQLKGAETQEGDELGD